MKDFKDCKSNWAVDRSLGKQHAGQVAKDQTWTNRPTEKLFFRLSIYLLSTADAPGTLQRHLWLCWCWGLRQERLQACTELPAWVVEVKNVVCLGDFCSLSIFCLHPECALPHICPSSLSYNKSCSQKSNKPYDVMDYFSRKASVLKQ